MIGSRFHELCHCASIKLARAGGDTGTARILVGHKSPTMWKRYDAIREQDLTQAAERLHKHLRENRPGTRGEGIPEDREARRLTIQDAPVAQLDRASAF